MNAATFDLRAVFFDFDGTLADSYAAIAASVNHVRGLHNLPPLGIEEVTRFVGRGAEYLLRNTVASSDVAADVAAYKAHHPGVMRPLTRLLPGAAEALEAVKARGLRAGVCSNKPRPFTTELLKTLGIDHFFDVVIGPEDVARPKPAPDMLLLAIERAGIQPAQALYIGDMVVDIETARAAGVCVWCVPTGSENIHALVNARPDRMLADLRELAAALPLNT